MTSHVGHMAKQMNGAIFRSTFARRGEKQQFKSKNRFWMRDKPARHLIKYQMQRADIHSLISDCVRGDTEAVSASSHTHTHAHSHRRNVKIIQFWIAFRAEHLIKHTCRARTYSYSNLSIWLLWMITISLYAIRCPFNSGQQQRRTRPRTSIHRRCEPRRLHLSRRCCECVNGERPATDKRRRKPNTGGKIWCVTAGHRKPFVLMIVSFGVLCSSDDRRKSTVAVLTNNGCLSNQPEIWKRHPKIDEMHFSSDPKRFGRCPLSEMLNALMVNLLPINSIWSWEKSTKVWWINFDVPFTGKPSEVFGYDVSVCPRDTRIKLLWI